jgi:hypothetical protein
VYSAATESSVLPSHHHLSKKLFKGAVLSSLPSNCPASYRACPPFLFNLETEIFLGISLTHAAKTTLIHPSITSNTSNDPVICARMEGSSQLQTCLPNLYGLSPCAPPPCHLAPFPNENKLLLQQTPLVQEQAGNHGVMLSSSDNHGGLYPLLLPGIPFCPTSAAACDKTTGFAPLEAVEVNDAPREM